MVPHFQDNVTDVFSFTISTQYYQSLLDALYSYIYLREICALYFVQDFAQSSSTYDLAVQTFTIIQNVHKNPYIHTFGQTNLLLMFYGILNYTCKGY